MSFHLSAGAFTCCSFYSCSINNLAAVPYIDSESISNIHCRYLRLIDANLLLTTAITLSISHAICRLSKSLSSIGSTISLGHLSHGRIFSVLTISGLLPG